MTTDDGITCPCHIGHLRVVRTTVVLGGIERERRCPNGHRVITIEVTRFLRRLVVRKRPVKTIIATEEP